MEPIEVSLELPPDPRQVGTARMFIGAAGRLLHLDEEGIEDLKIAVSEACNGAIEANRTSGADTPILVALSASPSALEVRIHSDGVLPGTATRQEKSMDTGALQQAMGRGLISSLFPSAEWREELGEGTDLKLTIPRFPVES